MPEHGKIKPCMIMEQVEEMKLLEMVFIQLHSPNIETTADEYNFLWRLKLNLEPNTRILNLGRTFRLCMSLIIASPKQISAMCVWLFQIMIWELSVMVEVVSMNINSPDYQTTIIMQHSSRMKKTSGIIARCATVEAHGHVETM